MTKLLKILGNLLFSSIEIMVLVLIVLLFLIRSTRFQTFLAQQGTQYLTEKLGVPVSIHKVDIAFIDKIFINGVYVEDLKKDTLLYVNELAINYNFRTLIWPKIYVDKVKIAGITAKLKKYKGESQLNLQFIIDAFTSKKSTPMPNFIVKVGQVDLQDIHFIYQDQNIKNIPFGVDYSHIDVQDFSLAANDVVISPHSYRANIETLAFKEHSGFQLKQLSGITDFSPKGLKIKNLAIKTAQSTLDLPFFQLKMNQLSDFSSFVDSVALISNINPSKVSLAEVSLFAPQLYGMDAMVNITGNTRQTIKNFEMNNIELKYGVGTVIKGDFSLPDFRSLSKDNMHQEIQYISVTTQDLKRFTLPSNNGKKTLSWPSSLDNLNRIEATNLRFSGKLHDLNFKVNEINSNLGKVAFNDTFRLISDSTFSYIKLTPLHQKENQITLHDFDIRSVIKNQEIGRLNGVLTFRSLVMKNQVLQINDASGLLQNISLYGYSYDFIDLGKVDYIIDNRGIPTVNKIEGNFYIRDENLDLSFQGKASLGKKFTIHSKIALECANLHAIHPKLKNRGNLETVIEIDAKGADFQHFITRLSIDTFHYKEKGQIFSTSNFRGFMMKNMQKDSIWIRSDIVDASIEGNINFVEVADNIIYQLDQLFPIITNDTTIKEFDTLNYFNYAVTIKNLNPLLNIFVPQLQIAKNTNIEGRYEAKDGIISLNLLADFIYYDSMEFHTITVQQNVMNGELLGLINIAATKLNDSLSFNNIHFTGLAANGTLDAQLLFDDFDGHRSNLQWLTHFNNSSLITINFLPSLLDLHGKEWILKENATITYKNNAIYVKDFELENNKQFIAANGILSDSIKDKLYVDLMGFRLDEFGSLLGSKQSWEGVANVTGFITSPFTDFRFFGEAIVRNLKINQSEVGNVSCGINYGSDGTHLNMYGDIYYRNSHTFHFDGFYLTNAPEEKENLLNFNMQFNKTDIGVINEFLDPDVIKDFKGKLVGELSLKGTIEKPVVNGTLEVKDGMVNLAILGADFYFGGNILVTEKAISIKSIPLTDEEGNMGFISGELTHHNFKDFQFDIGINLEENPLKGMPGFIPTPAAFNRFLVMNTSYSLDNAYYGKAYILGQAKISGTASNLRITVNATTQKGTKIIIPMYGPTTVENEGFITFKKPNDSIDNHDKIDLSGVDLRLHFNVTDDAEVQLIFDKNTGDAITARGHGNISLSVNQANQLEMDGIYTVKTGLYNFSMGPYKQKFSIREGGTVSWAGSPYNANLNIKAYYKTRANLAVVMPADILNNSGSTNQEIFANMNVTGQLTKPDIAFDLRAPQASESGKAILARIRSNQDELNRQFFSILITKSFLPLNGGVGKGGGGSNALLDLASSQINSILNKMTEGYQMNVNLDNDQYSGEFLGELGVSKSFLDDRLIVSGSFGIGSVKNGATNASGVAQNRFIGDVKLEYLLNKAGTFRFNVFNKSNDYTILQNEGKGQFSQGIGISYKENFYSIRDFQLIQSLINIFRKKEKDVHLNKNNNKKVPIPEKHLPQKGLKELE